MAIQQLAYVEYFDRLEFPNVDVRNGGKSEISGQWSPYHRQTVILVVGDCVDPRTGDADGEGFVALAGHEHIAETLIEIALDDNPNLGNTAVDSWIADSERAALDEHDWRRRWNAELTANPIFTTAFNRGRDELFDRAGLTSPQLLAMRMVFGDPPMSQRQAAVQLGISEQSLAERLRGAKDRLKRMISDTGAITTELKP